MEAPPLSRRSRAGGAAARVKTGGLGTERGVAEFFPQCITPSSVNWGENRKGWNMHPPLLFTEEFEPVIMIETVTEEMHGSD